MNFLRLRIRFGIEPGSLLDFNYQWHLTAMVYQVLSLTAPDFTKRLHDAGYPHLAGPDFKFFTFSTLWAGKGKTKVQKGMLKFLTDSLLWRFDTPVPVVATLMAEGLLAKGNVRVGPLVMSVEEVLDEPPPDFSSGTACFTCISPLVASLADETLGHRYLSPGESRFWQVVAENLRKKWQTLHGQPATGHVEFCPDHHYLASRNTGKLITLKGNNVIKGHLVPFKLTAPPQMIHLGYSAGFGSRNSLGFGMVEVRKVY